MTGGTVNAMFHRFSRGVADAAGHAVAFALALALIVAWAIAGPFLGFSEVWQLTINTVTTIITFLLVFVIQHTQVTNEKAMQAKLDELIRSLPEPDSTIAGIERDD